MSSQLNKKQIDKIAKELAKDLKTPEDLNKLSRALLKASLETALEVEMEDHLGYEKHEKEQRTDGNSRNGYSRKTLKTDQGNMEIQTPRDRHGAFEPQIVKKGERRTGALDSQILSLYAKGMSTRDISATFEEMYGTKVSHTLIANVTEAVMDEVEEWQNRPLDAVYPIVYLDCLVVKVRQDKRVVNKSVYLAVGINREGHKELLGMWIAETEGSKFWMNVLTELKNRGLKDIFIVCIDGLKGFPEAIMAVYPQSKVQLCIVHMVRNSLKYVSWKNRKTVAARLKEIYCSATERAAEKELERFEEDWGEQYPSIVKSWREHWPNLITFFSYPEDIRRVIYTTNAIESINSSIRKVIKNRKIFPKDNSVFKVIYLAIEQVSKKWTMPVRNWGEALNRFEIEFGDRLHQQ